VAGRVGPGDREQHPGVVGPTAAEDQHPVAHLDPLLEALLEGRLDERRRGESRRS